MVYLDYSKDSLIGEFGIKRFKDGYMLESEKSPQQNFARTMTAFGDDEDHAQRLYNYASKLWFMPASPLLSNGGTDRGLPISCFGNYVEDSLESIGEQAVENIWLTSRGGGIGTYWGDVRSNGTSTSKGSKSTGVIPFIHWTDAQMLAFAQGSNRRGSSAVYMPLSHPEIEEFIGMRKPTGGDINRKNLNIHHGVCISDDFMEIIERCEKGEADTDDWDLIDPHSKEVVKTVSAKAIWQSIIETRMETGEPYIMWTDTVNKTQSPVHSALGLEIKQSNLCVAPETLVMTKEYGYIKIKELKNKRTNVWNGVEWSEVKIKKTGKNQKLLTINFSDGSTLDCTPYHKFYIQDNYNKSSVKEVRAQDLLSGMKLEKWELPTAVKHINYNSSSHKEAYSQGFYSGDGNRNLKHSWLYKEKYMCASNLIGDLGEEHKSSKRKTWHHGDMEDKYFVPFTDWMSSYRDLVYPMSYKISWLSGLFDADGTVVKSTNGDTIQLASIDRHFLTKVKYMLEEMGIQSKISLARGAGEFLMPNGKGGEAHYQCKEIHRILIATAGTKKLIDLGLDCLRLQFQKKQSPQRDAQRFVQVVSLKDKGRVSDTYCATEPKRGRILFNGVVTGNCSEILLPTGIDQYDNNRTFVCCLSSVNLEKFDEWKDEPLFIQDIIRMLDNVLDVFIKNAPAGMSRAVYSASMERSLGLGAMGFHAYLQSKNIPFESPMAVGQNKRMFGYIREQADKATEALAIERGNCPDVIDYNSKFGRDIQKRNVHLIAVAPNATSSILCGNTSPSIEPYAANTFRQETLSGWNIYRNRYLDRIIKDKCGSLPYEEITSPDDVWKDIAAHGGSIQHMTEWFTDQQREVFKTAKEIDQRWLVQHASDRYEFIDQAQSLNLFFDPDTSVKYLHRVHMEAWKKGLKTLYYCRSNAKHRAENINEKIERTIRPDYVSAVNNIVGGDDSECLACEG